jgi:5-methylcytosine-specific restriction endonuclease McrA
VTFGLNKINKKLYKFQKDNTMDKFTVQDVKDKLGEHPVCYLTGEQIDINKPNTYQFDHIIPRSRGGQSTLDNLGICTKRANLSKSDMTPDEFFNFCKIVLENQGYKVTKD